jgi:TolB-like protein/Flp pilus assembly protein TadD
MSLFEELKRRNVFRVGIAYAVVAWVLLQVVDLVLDNITAPEWIMKVFMLAVAVGFPVAVIIAWAFEMTPEGLKRETEVDRSQSITPKTGHKLDRLIIVFLAVAVVVLLAERMYVGDERLPAVSTAVDSEKSSADISAQSTNPVSRAQGNSIAVLPFVNMSADPDNEYFSDGIAEEILNVLARIPELKVAARTSAFAFKGTNINIAEIARTLNVDVVLEGSVRKFGNQVRVTAQLIKAADGYHLWSETYDRELTNIFAIQDEIAKSIADELKLTLDIDTGVAGNMTGTTSTAAYDAYLRGMNQWHLRTGESLRNSIELFGQAIAIDPKFARAYAGLALTYAILDAYTDVPWSETRQKTRLAADQALAIDPGLAEAATALIFTTEDVNEQLAFGRRAIELGPSFATAHQWYAGTIISTGDLDGALEEYLVAYELDPRSRIVGANLSENYRAMGNFSDAERVLRQVASFAPDFYYVHELLFGIYLRTGDLKSAESEGRQLARILGRDEAAVQVYLDLYSDGAKKQIALEKLMSWPRSEQWSGANPGLLFEGLPVLLAAAGAWPEARVVLKEVIQSFPAYIYAALRADRTIAAFNCSPETQAIYAASRLAPLAVPYPCEDQTQ